ncbi:Rv1535 domain-containing protein [Rhodococcus sp. WAY2]|nr:Rv1535 domain-containing protein [Rhodococcus sp. WAY2]QHE71022.1 hypothetical protein GFS60_04619 [Rhodococcus sp. WAY2]
MAKTGIDVSADPIVSVVAQAITPPLRELYALLVRAGVVEIVD